MYENETYEVILERMLDRISDKLDKRPSSVIYDTHSATAIEFQILYIELEYLIKNSYGDTAAREFLILLAKDRGFSPDAASKAVLQGEFTPANIDVTGRRFNIGDMNYVVLNQIQPGQYKVQCETAGVIGNQYLGDMIPIEYIDGLQSAQLTKLLIPGKDEEDTEAFRQRYFDSFNEKSFSGNQADYLSKTRKINGVGNCKVTRTWNNDIRPADMIPNEKVNEWYHSIITGLDADVAAWLSAVYMASYEKKLTVGGTVLITIIDSDDFGVASDALIDAVQETLDPMQNAGEGYGLAPIGHVVNVRSAESVLTYVTTTITFDEGYGWSNLKAPITEAVDTYLLELRQAWANSSFIVVRISQIESRILAVKGIADIANTKLNGSSENLILGKYEIPIMGGVSE